jgi:hypothetical protein
MWRLALELGATVIGWSSSPIGIALLTVAGVSGAVTLTRLVWKHRRQLEPSQLIVLGLVGGWLLFGIAIMGAIWKLYQPAIEPSEISELQTKVEGVQSSFDSYVKPRTLTEAQSKIISDYLLPRSHHSVTIYFTYPNDEAQQLASQIFNALRLAEWDVSMNAAADGKLQNGQTLSPGVQYHVQYGSGSKGTSRAVDLIQQAFNAANVTFMSGGGGSGSPRLLSRLKML